jgi:hypothetical protein
MASCSEVSMAATSGPDGGRATLDGRHGSMKSKEGRRKTMHGIPGDQRRRN